MKRLVGPLLIKQNECILACLISIENFYLVEVKTKKIWWIFVFWRFIDSRIVKTCDELDLLWNLMKFKFDTDWRCCSVLFAKWLKAKAIKESTKNEPNIIISIFVFTQHLTNIEYDYYHSMFSQLFFKKQFLSESQLLTYAACVALAARPVLSVL